MSKSTLALTPNFYLTFYRTTREFSEGKHVSFCGIYIAVSGNYSGQNFSWGQGLQSSQCLILHRLHTVYILSGLHLKMNLNQKPIN